MISHIRTTIRITVFIFSVFRSCFKLIKCRNPHTSCFMFTIITHRFNFHTSPTLNWFISMIIRIIDVISLIPSIKFCFSFSFHFSIFLIIVFSLYCFTIIMNNIKSISFLSINHRIVTSTISFIAFRYSITIYSTIRNYSYITRIIFFYTFINSLPKS